MPRTPLALRGRILLVRHRRPLVAGLVALAVAGGLQSARPGAGPMRTVLVATRDLPAGHRLATGDLARRDWPAGVLPDGAITRPSAGVLVGAIRRGEPLTDVRVATGSGGDAARVLAGEPPAGLVAVTVRLSDPASALVARPGERADVIAGAPTDTLAGSGSGSGSGSGTGPGVAGAGVVAPGAMVLAVPAGSGASGGRTASDGSDPGSGPGLFGALSSGASPAQASGSEGAGPTTPPAGVVVVAVPPGDALRLAAVAGVRTLSLARHSPMST